METGPHKLIMVCYSSAHKVIGPNECHPDKEFEGKPLIFSLTGDLKTCKKKYKLLRKLINELVEEIEVNNKLEETEEGSESGN